MAVGGERDGEVAETGVRRSEAPDAGPPRQGTSRPPSRRPRNHGVVRLHPRHQVRIAIGLASQGGEDDDTIAENLSVGGVFVATRRERPAVGEEIELTLVLPNVNEPLRCLGRVAWLREGSSEGGLSPGMGIEFAESEEAVRVAIRQFLSYHDPDGGG